ncbi:DUF5988 family protein [Catenulispora rubra]|uniref:DUF5988 family protein n=1 Tax=Catenulispora rubra TaxID=280293 RepID=UPI00189273CA|nr:DUF5988 family protein [Catenulispora rubra]
MSDSLREPNVILRGGPAALSGKKRVRSVADSDSVLKLQNGNRYDHYESTSETVIDDGRLLKVFVWVQCTYVAE